MRFPGGVTLNGRTPIWVAVIGNSAVAAATFAIYGWNASAAHAAARYTARFSLLWFIVGFAAPGLARFVRSLPSETRLIQAVVGAHLVHFAVVGGLIAIFERTPFLQNPARSAAVVVLGFAVVLGAGLTATQRGASRLYSAVHQSLLYVIFLIFFLAYARNPVKLLRLLVVGLGLAIVLRLARGVIFRRAPSETARHR